MKEWITFASKEDLISIRIRKGWTQEELAEYSGIIIDSIKKFEDGTRIPSPPIQHCLYLTFRRLEDTINSYRKLSPDEKRKFNKEFNLDQKHIYGYDWKLTSLRNEE